jgi:hypothetical protein
MIYQATRQRLRKLSARRRVSQIEVDPAVLRDRERHRLYKRSLTPNVRPEDTITLTGDEYRMLHLLYRFGGNHHYWRMLNYLGGRYGTHLHVSRPERRKQLALLQRLIDARLVFRAWRSDDLTLLPSGEWRLRVLSGVERRAYGVAGGG